MSSQKTIDLTGTHIAMGVTLHRLFFGMWAYGFYALLLINLLAILWLADEPTALIIGIALLFFPILVLHLFLRDTFKGTTTDPEWTGCDAEYLAFSIVRTLRTLRAVEPADLLTASMKTPAGCFIVQEMGCTPKEFLVRARRALHEAPPLDTDTLVAHARKCMEQSERKRIDAGVLLYAFFEHVKTFEDILHDYDLSMQDLAAILRWESFHARFRKRDALLSPEVLLRIFGGVGRSWVMGYTDALDCLTVDLSAHALWTRRHVQIHTRECKSTLRILEKSDLHDLLLIGKVGVGKKTLIENIAYAIRRAERHQFRAYTRILILKTEELLSGTANPDMFLLQALKKAQQSGRFILVIHNLSLMLQSGGENIRAILMKFLREENVQIIGVISTEDYHRFVKSDPTLDHFFEKLTVPEATDGETMAIMMEHYFRVAEKSRVRVTYKALRSILDLSRRYLASQAFPGKAVSVLEDAMGLAAHAKDAFVGEQHIREIISQKSRIDITKISQGERDRLLYLDRTLKERIVGQEDAVYALVNTLKRARLELRENKRPLGTFLFLGPTGVGKTHTAKVLAEQYFGSEENMIRLDMNEYSTETSVAGIVGSADGLTGGYLARRVQDQPFSLILLDEIEKAHPKVLNVFLQVLDEGALIDFSGAKTDFRNTIIVATSNAGALFIRDYFRAHDESDHAAFKQQLFDHILQEHVFSPEFLNRFDDVVLYYPLTKQEAMHVAILMLDDIVREMRERRGIRLKVEEDVVLSIVERGYSREFGAREMRRTIVEMVENHLANYMLRHEVQRGDEVVIRRENTEQHPA